MTCRPYLKITTHKIIKSNHIGQRAMLCTMHLITYTCSKIIKFLWQFNYYVINKNVTKTIRGQGAAPLAGSVIKLQSN